MRKDYKKEKLEDIQREDSIKKAKKLEKAAFSMKRKHLGGDPSIKPEEIGKKYEEAGDILRKAKNFVEAESDYLEAQKYGYFYSPDDLKRVKEKIKELISEKKIFYHFQGGLERYVSFLAIGSLIGALFFISFSLTGSTIAKLTRENFNLFGLGLFILGLVFSFVYFKNKK